MRNFKTSNFKLNRTFYFLAVFFVFWVLCWLLKLFLDAKSLWTKTDEGAFVYWLSAKLLIWIIPSIIFLRLSEKSLGDVFGTQNLRRTIIYGGGFGILFSLMNILAKTFVFHTPFISYTSALTFVSAVLISPIVEEVFFRGAVLNGFLDSYSFKTANSLTAVFFLLIHFPGWYFQGNLVNNLTSQIAFTVFLLGLIFGYIAYKSNSIIGAMIAHSLNNLTS